MMNGCRGRERRSTLLHFRTVHKGMNFAQRIWDSDCIFCEHELNPNEQSRDCLRKIVAQQCQRRLRVLSLRTVAS